MTTVLYKLIKGAFRTSKTKPTTNIDLIKLYIGLVKSITTSEIILTEYKTKSKKAVPAHEEASVVAKTVKTAAKQVAKAGAKAPAKVTEKAAAKAKLGLKKPPEGRRTAG